MEWLIPVSIIVLLVVAISVLPSLLLRIGSLAAVLIAVL